MKLKGNTILITGGGTGIGRALADALYAHGNEIIIAGRRQSMLDDAMQGKPRMHGVALDIEDAAAIREVAADVASRFPALNVVIHCAGIMRQENLLDEHMEDAEHIITTNLLGTMRMNQALIGHLKSQRNATIMTVSSGLAFLPLAATPSYSASKAAIHSYTQSLRLQLEPVGIEVLELIPPYVQTELMGKRQATDPLAMPLDEFISETIDIIEEGGEDGEICVERVMMQRFAEASGEYYAILDRFNHHINASRKGPPAD
jgi:uncharacterized oxidoreductase